MFYKIGNKYYVKMANYYQEVEVIKDNIIPKKGEENRVYNPNEKIEAISYKDLIEKSKIKPRIKKIKADIL